MLSDGGEREYPLSDGEAVEDGAYVVLGRSAVAEENMGLEVDHTYGGFTLTNGGDTVVVSCGGVEIDMVSYTGDVVVEGASIQLDPGALDTEENDDMASWCPGTTEYGTGGLLGTPGAENELCPVRDTTVDRCKLQWPVQARVLVAAEVVTYGRVFEAGVTDQSDGVDPLEELLAQAGYGPRGSDPAADDSWTWVDAAGNAEWGPESEAFEAGWDEYGVALTAPEAGEWDLAYRFSRDAGETWTLCDTGDGSDDGYSAADAGKLETVADPCTPDPCTEPPGPACEADGLTLTTHSAEDACALTEDLEADCVYTPSTQLCADTGHVCKDGACVLPVRPVAKGHVIITELMPKSVDGGSDGGEWVELLNMTDKQIGLSGCLLTDGGDEKHTISTLVLLEVGGYAVLGRSDDPEKNHGLEPDYVYSGFNLKNGGDTVALRCGEAVIDIVSYSGGQVITGAAIQLDSEDLDVDLNDDPVSWCPATEAYGSAGMLGTPGAPNGDCPEPDVTIDYCRLQWPDTVREIEGSEISVYGRVYEDGVTNQSDEVDTHDDVLAQAGYGPRGTEPDEGGSWTWLDAAPNDEWRAEHQHYEVDVDEYRADFAAPAAAEYDLAYRFSRDGGATWKLCDRQVTDSNASDDGYQVANAGHLETIADPCTVNPCTMPGPDECKEDGRTLLVEPNPGTCAVDEDLAPQCSYVPAETDCFKQDQICEAGACLSVPKPSAKGDLVFTELLQSSKTGTDRGEWIEIHNTTAGRLDIVGCEIVDADEAGHVIAQPLVVEAEGYVILGLSDDPEKNHGVMPDYVLKAVSLNNTGDSLKLTCEGVEIDALTYERDHVLMGAAWQLDPQSFDADANDLPESWCISAVLRDESGPFFGTPGEPNAACPPPGALVDWCRLQVPAVADVDAAEEAVAYGRVYVAGLTDRSDGNDLHPLLRGQAGFGPEGSDPSAVPESWLWFDAEKNGDYGPGSPSHEANNDEHVASVVSMVPGSYDLAFRFSLDDGVTWRLCDRYIVDGQDGSEDGYSPEHAGKLNEAPTPCIPNPCTTPDPDFCDSDTGLAVAYPAVGVCSIVEDVAQCSYEATSTDCSTGELICEDGRCVVPLAGPQPAAGEVIVTEIMAAPAAGKVKAEWIEVFNTTEQTLDIGRCELKDEGSDSHAVEGSLPIGPGAYLVLGRNGEASENAGLEPDYVYKGFQLGNDEDEVVISCKSVVVDRVAYTADDVHAGAATQLDNQALDATSNDDITNNWCAATQPYGDSTNLGTPGNPNEQCQ